MRLSWALSAIAIALVDAAAIGQTVAFSLDSSKDGKAVTPGTMIDWTIRVAVSSGDNAGLALACCDLVQSSSNPALFDIPPADAGSIDPNMLNFSRPLGISNPGEGGADSGYIGVQRGPDGQKNLIQLGGSQNSFGQALPAGSGLAENDTVIPGIGQSAAPQILVSGQFPAPAAPGKYTFSLENALANVLDVVNPPPNYSPVTSVTPDTSSASFSFTVGVAPVKGPAVPNQHQKPAEPLPAP
jgi:hypothetical protein